MFDLDDFVSACRCQRDAAHVQPAVSFRPHRECCPLEVFRCLCDQTLVAFGSPLSICWAACSWWVMTLIGWFGCELAVAARLSHTVYSQVDALRRCGVHTPPASEQVIRECSGWYRGAQDATAPQWYSFGLISRRVLSSFGSAAPTPN